MVRLLSLSYYNNKNRFLLYTNNAYSRSVVEKFKMLLTMIKE